MQLPNPSSNKPAGSQQSCSDLQREAQLRSIINQLSNSTLYLTELRELEDLIEGQRTKIPKDKLLELYFDRLRHFTRPDSSSNFAEKLKELCRQFRDPENSDSVEALVCKDKRHILRKLFSREPPPGCVINVLQRLASLPHLNEVEVDLESTPNQKAQWCLDLLGLRSAAAMDHQACSQVHNSFWMLEFIQICIDIKTDYKLPSSLVHLLLDVPCGALQELFRDMGHNFLRAMCPPESVNDAVLFIIIGASVPQLDTVIATWIGLQDFQKLLSDSLSQMQASRAAEDTALVILAALSALRIAPAHCNKSMFDPICDMLSHRPRNGLPDYRRLFSTAAQDLLDVLRYSESQGSLDQGYRKTIRLLVRVLYTNRPSDLHEHLDLDFRPLWRRSFIALYQKEQIVFDIQDEEGHYGPWTARTKH